MLISSSSRYSIYKVQWSVLVSLSLTRTFISYHIFKLLSRTFFEVFWLSLVFAIFAVWQLFNFNTLKTVCQALFSFFFKLFKSCFSIALPLETTFIEYHTLLHLSRTFFISFRLFWSARIKPVSKFCSCSILFAALADSLHILSQP